MPRATEHVFALHSQWVGVVDSISDLEESLRRVRPPSSPSPSSSPPARGRRATDGEKRKRLQPPSRPTPQAQHDDSYYRQLELEDAIRREEMELFAVEQIKAELEAKVRFLPLFAFSLFLSPY